MPNMRWHLTLSAPRTRRNIGAELVFQTGVDAFGHGAEIVDQVVEVGPVDELQALDFAAPFGLGLVVGAKVAVDDRSVAQRPALVVDRGGVVGGVHEIVEIGDAGAGHGHQGNGDLAVVDEAEVSTQETGIWPQATSMWSLYPVQVSL